MGITTTMHLDNVVLDTRSAFAFSMGTVTPAATAAASAVEQAFTPPAGSPALKVGDIIHIVGPASGNNVTVGSCRVNATFQLVIQYVNPTAGSLTHAAGAVNVLVVRV